MMSHIVLLLLPFSSHALKLPVDPTEAAVTLTGETEEFQQYLVHLTNANGIDGYVDGVGKVVFFFTTHDSAQHIEFLKNCWPQLMSTQLPLLSKADIIIHSNGGLQNKEALQQILEAFPNKVHRVAKSIEGNRAHSSYGPGATQSVVEALEQDFFVKYDWVIRLQPDVIILHENPILEKMSEKKHAAVFADCNRQGINTDWFAVRPQYLDKDCWVGKWRKNPNVPPANNPEHFAKICFQNILNQEMDSWVSGGSPGGSCRISNNDILHDHKRGMKECNALITAATTATTATLSKVDAQVVHELSQPLYLLG